MPLASYPSNLAACLCRRFRRPSRNVRILQVCARRFNTSARRSSEEKEPKTVVLEPFSDLLILRIRAQRKSRHENLRFQSNPLDPETLDSTRDLLLKPEILDDESIDIALVRPKENVPVSKERYVQLAQQLSKSFLKAQLLKYYQSLDGGKEPPRLHPAANKQEIIEGILDDKWGVVVSCDIPERADVLVNRVFPGTRRDIFFILGEDGRMMRQLSQQYQARVRVNVESCKISVDASLENFEHLRKAIRGLLEKVAVEEFDISWAQRLCQFNEQFITPISRITGTYIEKKDDKTLSISALDTSSLQGARRLLLVSFDLQLRSSYSLLYNAPKERGDPKGALYPVHEKSALPWNFRGVEWGRWRNIKMYIKHGGMPRVKSSALLKDTRRARIRGVLQDTNIATGLREVLDYNDLQVSTQHQSELLHQYEAILGYLLHENSNPQPDQDLTAPEFIESEDRLQVFLTDVPGLVHITQTLPPISETTFGGVSHSLRVQESTSRQRAPYQTCIVKLLPVPWEYPEGFDRYPPLELKFSIDPELGEVGQPSLRAIHSSTIADTMFPGEECDVRFHHQKFIPLVLGDLANPQPKYGVTQLELKRYMSESTLNPLIDDKLKASQSLRVTLPEWMISPPKRSESEDGKEERSPPTKMEYISTGLEYRRELAFDWKGMKLYQTVVHGGVTGGRRSEFKLCWNDNERADLVAETPRTTGLESDGKVIDEVAEGSRHKLAVEAPPEAVAETIVVSDTEAADGIPSKPAVDTSAEDVGEPGDKITEPTADQSLRHTLRGPYCYPPPDARSSFSDFLMNTADLVKHLGEFLASKEWRFTTQYTARGAAQGVTRGVERGHVGGRDVGSGGCGRGSGGD